MTKKKLRPKNEFLYLGQNSKLEVINETRLPKPKKHLCSGTMSSVQKTHITIPKSVARPRIMKRSRDSSPNFSMHSSSSMRRLSNFSRLGSEHHPY